MEIMTFIIPGPEKAGNGDSKQDLGKCEEDVECPHDDQRLIFPPRITGHESEQYAERAGDRNGYDARGQRHSSSPDKAGQDIPALTIQAQNVPRGSNGLQPQAESAKFGS